MTAPPNAEQPAVDVDPAAEYARALQTATELLQTLQALQPRLHTCREESLRALLDQQVIQLKENLVMVLEWLRQQDAVLDAHMRAYFFQRASPEEETTAAIPAPLPVEIPASPEPVTTPAKGMPLTLPNQRIRG